MLIDQLKEQVAHKVEQTIESKLSEVEELFVKLTGADKENCDNVLENVKVAGGQMHNWLKVLCYPVFAPDHKGACEYILRKLVLFKKIKASLDDDKLEEIKTKIEQAIQPFQDKIDKQTKSLMIFPEDGTFEASDIEIWRLRYLLDLCDDSVETCIYALEGSKTALLEKLKMNEISQQKMNEILPHLKNLFCMDTFPFWHQGVC